MPDNLDFDNNSVQVWYPWWGYGSSVSGGAASPPSPPGPPPAPVADFIGSPTSGDADLIVAFTDLSTNLPTSWLWEKDDGGGFVSFSNTPTVQNPVETFSTGTYDIRLTATNDGGSDAETKTGYITATSPPPPPASGVTYDTSGAVNSSIYADVTTTVVGKTTAGSNRYGVVKVSVSSAGTVGNMVSGVTWAGAPCTRLKYVDRGSSGTGCAAIYGIANPPTAASNIVATFSGNSFGEVVACSYSGVDQTSPVRSTISGVGVDSSPSVTVPSTALGDMVIDVAYVQEKAVTVGANQTSVFNNSTTPIGINGTCASYQNGVDGGVMSWDQVSIAPNSWAQVAVSLQPASPPPGPPPSPGPSPPPTANFSGTPTSGAAPLTVAFTDSSTNTPTSWLWQKNDGSGLVNFSGTPTSQNPSEDFAAGTWDIKLTATNASGSGNTTKSGYITATSPPPPPGSSVASDGQSDESNYVYADTTCTLTGKTTAGSNRYGLVEIGASIFGTPGSFITGVTWGGDACTQLKYRDEGFSGARCAALYGIAAPPTGASNIVVTFGGNAFGRVSASSYVNVNQSSPVRSSISGAGTDSNPSITIPTTDADDLIIDAVCVTDHQVDVGANQTEILNGSGSLVAGSSLCSSEQDGADGGVMSWTATGSPPKWTGVAVSLQKA